MSRGFDPRREGTAECVWNAALSGLAKLDPPRGPLLVVAPHPDDETLGAGGLIYTCAKRGVQLTIVLLTDGERSRDDVANLADVRVGELNRARRALGVPEGRLVRLGLPDGQLGHYEEDIVEFLAALACAQTTLILPLASDGHPDHEAAARAGQRVATRSALTALEYPIWAWHHCAPGELDLSRGRYFALSSRAQQAKGLDDPT